MGRDKRSMADWIDRGEQLVSPNYRPKSVVMDHGEGAYVYDREGRAYLDFLAGVAVNSLGYNHPMLVDALQRQAERALHVSNLFYSAEQIEAFEAITERSFADRVFLCNSGTESTEAALKLARRYQRAVAGEERSVILSMEGSFHGRTMGAIKATGQPKYHEGFGPLVPNIEYTPFNDSECAAEAIDGETAAVIVEPVQGEGGVRPADRAFLETLRERCDETGALLIFDEVQTGVGRTGDLFAYQGYGVTPDIMCLAKGLGGGVPVGATVATEEVFEGWTYGSHASTFGGNPMASVAAATVLEVIDDEELCENADRRGEQLKKGLEAIVDDSDDLREVRGRGLMVGVECRDGDLAGTIADHCRESEQLLVNTAGEATVRLVPPLIVSDDDVDEAVERFGRTVEAVGGD